MQVLNCRIMITRWERQKKLLGKMLILLLILRLKRKKINTINSPSSFVVSTDALHDKVAQPQSLNKNKITNNSLNRPCWLTRCKFIANLKFFTGFKNLTRQCLMAVASTYRWWKKMRWYPFKIVLICSWGSVISYETKLSKIKILQNIKI